MRSRPLRLTALSFGLLAACEIGTTGNEIQGDAGHLSSGGGDGASVVLEVNKSGTGSGTISSSPPGISCGSTCSASYAIRTSVTLTATAASGSTFSGWSGACSGTAACTIGLSTAQTVSAAFSMSGGDGGGTGGDGGGTGGSGGGTDGSGGGTGGSGGSGGAISINAGGSVTGSFAADTYFSGGNTNSTTGAIDTSLLTRSVPPQAVLQTERYGEFTYTIPNLTPGSAQAVTLYFAEIHWTAPGKRTFDVAINGATVLSAFDVFAGAGGASKAIAQSFNTTANASGQVVIQFTRNGPDQPKVSGITVAAGGSGGTNYALTVNKSGTGSGTVGSSPGGIDCGSTCSASYASGTSVTLTASPANGSTFAGWSGACNGTGACAVGMSAAQTVTATFDTGGGAGCGVPTSFRWSSTGPVISAPSGFTSIKDPSVVFYNNLWHVFASVTDSGGNYSIQYLNFSDWNQAGSASKSTTPFGNGHAAPQVFYFTPQHKWYMIYEWGNVYSTNTDLSNASGWSSPKSFYATEPPIVAQNKGSGGMIDFWVICDAANCYLFFSDDNGHLYRGQTTVASFPNGFSQPVIVMSDSPAGRLFEGCNVYSMTGTGKYLLLVEAFDSGSNGRRYFRSWMASALDGAWTPLQAEYSTPFASGANVTFNGSAWTQDISHGEMLRSGYDEKLEIDTCNLQFLYQGLDPGASGGYNTLPWKLGLLTKTN